MTLTIQDYAIIGDGRSCALVTKTGSINFLYWAPFDSFLSIADPRIAGTIATIKRDLVGRGLLSEECGVCSRSLTGNIHQTAP